MALLLWSVLILVAGLAARMDLALWSAVYLVSGLVVLSVMDFCDRQWQAEHMTLPILILILLTWPLAVALWLSALLRASLRREFHR